MGWVLFWQVIRLAPGGKFWATLFIGCLREAEGFAYREFPYRLRNRGIAAGGILVLRPCVWFVSRHASIHKARTPGL